MGLAEGVTTGDEGESLLVIHGHATEGFADIAGCEEGVGVAVGAFRIDVDEAHLDCGQGLGELTIAAVAFVCHELLFRAPVDEFGFPVVTASTGEAEGFEAHGFEGNVAGEDHEVAPGNFLAVLLFDGPEEAAGFVEVGIVGPAVEGFEALLSAICTATAIEGAVGAGAVPGHADEEGAVVTIVSGPPGLRGGEDLLEIQLDGIEVEGCESFGVVEVLAEGVGFSGVLS